MSYISTVDIDITQLSYLLEHDNKFLIQFLIPDEIKPESPVPDFHEKMLYDMTALTYQYYSAAVPRDHAKTTLAKIAAVKIFLFTPYRFILYVSNTSEVAASAANDIVGYIQGENFKHYHRAICGVDPIFNVEQTHHGNFQFILFPGHPKEKRCILKSLGAGKQVRGLNVDNQRPEVAIVDDLESNEQLDTDLGYKKIKKWFYGPFKKCLDKFNHKIIQIGNMISWNCLIRDHTESRFWHSVRYGALLSNGESLWKEAWSREKLALDFEQYKEQGMLDVWFAEMMNTPIAAGMGLIDAERINYKANCLPESLEMVFITVDPAISTKAWGHRTGIAVHGFNGLHWQVVATYAAQGMNPINLFDKIMELATYWRVNVVGIEAVAYQAALKYFFTHICLERHIEGMEFVDLFASARKTERFTVFAAQILNETYALNKDDVLLTTQLLFYDPSKKDNDCDLLDAAAYGPQMIQRYMGQIARTYSAMSALHGNGRSALVDFSPI